MKVNRVLLHSTRLYNNSLLLLDGKTMALFTQQSTVKLLTLVAALCVSIGALAFENLNAGMEYGKKRAFIGATILNPATDLQISNSTILVKQGRIVKIQPSSETIPDDYTVVDTKNKWIIPGLIDGHIHMAQSGSAFTRPDTFDATKISSYADDQRWLKNNLPTLLQNYLKLGITTVIDMGGPSEFIDDYRAITESGTYPDIYAAGALLSPFEVPQLDLNGETFTQVLSAKDTVAMVEKQLSLKTELIKFVWSQETGLSMEQLTELYKPAMALAKKHNKRVAVHAEGINDAKMAIKAGADILVHGVMNDPIDNDFIELMKRNNVTYMPTLTANIHYTELFKGELTFSAFEHQHSHKEIISSFDTLMENVDKTGQIFKLLLTYVPKVDMSDAELATLSKRDQAIIKQLRNPFSSKNEQIQKQNLKKAIGSGVNVAFGTDAGNPGTLHAASVYGEFLAWQQAGISNQDILKAATYGNAKALQLESKFGVLAAGNYANFVVLDNNPYKALETLTKPVMTIKRGVIINGDNRTN